MGTPGKSTALLLLVANAAVAQLLLEVEVDEFTNDRTQVIVNDEYCCCEDDTCDHRSTHTSLRDCKSNGRCDTKFTLILTQCHQTAVPCGVQGRVIRESPDVIRNSSYTLTLLVQNSSINAQGDIAIRIKAEDDDGTDGDQLIDFFDASLTTNMSNNNMSKNSFPLYGEHGVGELVISYFLSTPASCGMYDVIVPLPTTTRSPRPSIAGSSLSSATESNTLQPDSASFVAWMSTTIVLLILLVFLAALLVIFGLVFYYKWLRKSLHSKGNQNRHGCPTSLHEGYPMDNMITSGSYPKNELGGKQTEEAEASYEVVQNTLYTAPGPSTGYESVGTDHENRIPKSLPQEDYREIRNRLYSLETSTNEQSGNDQKQDEMGSHLSGRNYEEI